MKQFIPNRELDELGTGVVLTYLKKSGTAGLPRCVDIEGMNMAAFLDILFCCSDRIAIFYDILVFFDVTKCYFMSCGNVGEDGECITVNCYDITFHQTFNSYCNVIACIDSD